MGDFLRTADAERPRRFTRAPGYRDYGRTGYEGELRNVGNEGSVWSGSFSGINGQYLNFNSTWLNPSNANNRAFGFQVRCLQHLSGVPVPFIFHSMGRVLSHSASRRPPQWMKAVRH